MLQLNAVHKTYWRGTPRERVALYGVDLRLAPGEFVTVVGSNGAGKSSLLGAVSGRVEIDSGAIRIDGTDVSHHPQHRRCRLVSLVLQDPAAGTCGALTVEENMALALGRGRRRGLKWSTGAVSRSFFVERLEPLAMGLERRLGDEVSTLSGGQRQALAMVMATMEEPSLLLLDEHTSALDPSAGEQVLALTQRMVAASGMTVLMITHNLDHALKCGSRTIMMDRGRIVLDLKGPTRQNLRPVDLLARFQSAVGRSFCEDRSLLA